MKQYDYLVVGAGLYGAVFAQKAHAAGKSVLVVDKRPNIAGNIYTEPVEGIQCPQVRRAHLPHQQQGGVGLCAAVRCFQPLHQLSRGQLPGRAVLLAF